MSNSTQQATIGATSFELFPELPDELKCLIWRYTFTPRYIQLQRIFNYQWPGEQFAHPDAPRLFFHERNKYPQPIALRVNSLSRTEALKYYKHILPEVVSFERIPPQISLPSWTYMHMELDTLCLLANDDNYSGTERLSATWRNIPDSFSAIRDLLLTHHETFTDVQNISMNNASWRAGVGEGDEEVQSSYVHLSRPGVVEGFPNLKKLILLAACRSDKDENRRSGINELWILDAERDKSCKSQIRELYEEERIRRGYGAVPEVVILRAPSTSQPWG